MGKIEVSQFYFRCSDTIVAICALYARFFADYDEPFPVGIGRLKQISDRFGTFTVVKYGLKWLSEFYFRCADTIVAICPLYARLFADYNEPFPVRIGCRKHILLSFSTFTMVKYGRKWLSEFYFRCADLIVAICSLYA